MFREKILKKCAFRLNGSKREKIVSESENLLYRANQLIAFIQALPDFQMIETFDGLYNWRYTGIKPKWKKFTPKSNHVAKHT